MLRLRTDAGETNEVLQFGEKAVTMSSRIRERLLHQRLTSRYFHLTKLWTAVRERVARATQRRLPVFSRGNRYYISYSYSYSCSRSVTRCPLVATGCLLMTTGALRSHGITRPVVCRVASPMACALVSHSSAYSATSSSSASNCARCVWSTCGCASQRKISRPATAIRWRGDVTRRSLK